MIPLAWWFALLLARIMHKIILTLPSCRDEILGLLLVKDLIILDKNQGVRAGEIRLRGVPFLQVATTILFLSPQPGTFS